MKLKFLFCHAFFLVSALAIGQKTVIYQNEDGAIKGYDPVAYFNANKALKGDKNISYEWMNATWYFTSEENLELFKRSPEKFIPQYGGYCSYAVAKGYTAKVDPTSWKVIDGKLYLSYNQSIMKNWENYQDKYIEEANDNWPEIIAAN